MKYWIDLHGCAKNQVDAEEMAARLEAAGHSYASGPAEADLVIVNTCGFIEDAKRESIGAIVSLKAARPGARLLVAGCLAQRYAKELAEGMPEADGILGNADLGAVVEAAERTLAGERPVLVPAAAAAPAPRRSRLFDFPGTAHVKITEGCSNFCSYCAIPLIRGALRSRPVEEVVAECAELVRPAAEGGRGLRELDLIGQDLGSYGAERGGQMLPDLLARLSALPGDFRVRVLYIHPDHFPDGILPVMAADPRILPYLDLPFQHASARILTAMNRRGDPDAYLRLIDRIRSVLPDAAIRSTFMVGFPGELDADFDELRSFQERARLDWVGAFVYSREEGTAAYSMRGRVPARVAAARKAAIEEAQERITRERLERFVGRELDVLVEERVQAPAAGAGSDAVASDDAELSLGRAWNQAPEVDGLTVLRGAREPGVVVRARVLAVTGVDFDAAIAG